MSEERGSYGSLTEVIQANKAAGQFFFSQGAMQWFDSRVESDVLRGCFFVTSEQAPAFRDEPRPARAFSVRVAYADGTVETVGDFQQHATLGAALDAVAQLVEEDA